MTVSKIISIFFGVVAFFGAWIFLYKSPDHNAIEKDLLILILITLILSLAYSLLHQQRYPVQTLAVLFVVEFLLLTVFGQNYHDRLVVGTYMYGVNMIGGSLFAIIGSTMARGFSKVFSPLQTRLRKEGVKLSIPVVAGVSAFIICFPLLAVRL